MTELDYRIVVPSRRRPFNMPRLLSLLPSATVCVGEEEAEAYAKHVPRKQLLSHPPEVIGGPVVRNWIIDNVKEPILVMSDDDLEGVRVTTGSFRFITNPDDIQDIIENAMQCCSDLDLTTFCFARTPQTHILDADVRPIRPTQQVFGLWGMMGRARHRRYDETLKSRADLDWTLRTLLEDRIVYADIRFYFDFKASFSNAGGNSGLVNADDFKKAAAILKKRWGKSVSFDPPGYVKQRETTTGSLRVKRQTDKGQS